jgi:hypothetical protein
VDWLRVDEFLRILLCPSMLMEEDRDFVAFDSKKAPPPRGPMFDQVYATVKDNGEWRAKYTVCLRVAMRARLLGPVYAKMKSTLDSCTTETRLQVLSDASAEMGRFHAVFENDTMGPLADSFLECFDVHMAEVIGLHKTGGLDAETAQKTQVALAAASDHFAQEKRIQVWMNEMSIVVVAAQEGSAKAQMSKALDAFTASGEVEDMIALTMIFERSKGIQMGTDEDKEKMMKLLSVIEKVTLRFVNEDVIELEPIRVVIDLARHAVTFTSGDDGGALGSRFRDFEEHFLKCIEDWEILWLVMIKLKAMGDTTDTEELRTSLDELYRQRDRCRKHMEKVINTELKNVLDAGSNDATDLGKAMAATLRDNNKADVIAIIDHVKTVLTDEINVEAWAECEGQDWKKARDKLVASVAKMTKPLELKKNLQIIVAVSFFVRCSG